MSEKCGMPPDQRMQTLLVPEEHFERLKRSCSMSETCGMSSDQEKQTLLAPKKHFTRLKRSCDSVTDQQAAKKGM